MRTGKGFLFTAVLTGTVCCGMVFGAQAATTDTLAVKIWDAKQQDGIQTICDE